MAKKLTYDESSIKTHSVAEGIRKKASLYIGATDSHGVFTILREAADNSVDEWHAKRNKYVHIAFENNVIYVIDNGAGIPVGKHKKEGLSTLTVVLTQLHAGGKFDADTYSHSGGTHGIGLKATNALSSFFQVWSKPKGKSDWHTTVFRKGKEISPVKKVKLKPSDLPRNVTIPKHGTIVAFTPDKNIFDKKSSFIRRHLYEWADLTAYINGGFKVLYTENGSTREWFHKGGIKDYIIDKIKKLKTETIGKPFILNDRNMEVCIQFSDYDGSNMEAYTNSVRNVDGGVHLTALNTSLATVLKTYSLKSQKFTAQDLQEGVVGLINYKISSPKFSSQTKEKLVDDRVKDTAIKILVKEFGTFFKDNKKLAKDLCSRAHDLRNAKAEFTLSKKAALKLKPKKNQKSLLSGKLMECRNCSSEERELLCVEGDSAAGPAKLARDLRYQEVLPLKGKILNVLKVKQEQKVWDNEEVMNILIAIGYQPNIKSPLDNLRVGKLVLLSDGDEDGSHINLLVLTLITKYLPGMFDRGLVYILEAPAFLLTTKTKTYFADTLDELREKVPKNTDMTKAVHLKGLGEMDPDTLREVALNPETRRITKVNKPSKKELKKFMDLMGPSTETRKKLLGL